MRTIQSLQIVFDEIKNWKSDSLLVLDIDETCLHGGDGYGSETWYEQVIQTYLDAGTPYSQAVMQANDLWESKQDDVQYFLTEKVLISILDHCLAKAIPTMGLTARRPEMSAATHKHLIELGVDLTKTARIKWAGVLSNEASYENGIIYGGPLVNKGQALIAFLEREKIQVSRVAFADDKKYHCESVETVCAERRIATHCFCYQRPHSPTYT
jgi:hypothetical protein